MGEGRGAISRCRVVVGTAATVKAQKQSCERVCVCVCACTRVQTRLCMHAHVLVRVCCMCVYRRRMLRELCVCAAAILLLPRACGAHGAYALCVCPLVTLCCRPALAARVQILPASPAAACPP